MATKDIAERIKDAEGIGEVDSNGWVRVSKYMIRGQLFDVWYLPGNWARFKSTGRYAVSGKSEEEIVEILKTKTRTAAVRIEIPISKIERIPTWSTEKEKFRLVHGILTGIHQGNGNLLVKWFTANGREHKEQIDSHYGRTSLFRRLTKEEAETVIRLRKEAQDAAAARNDFEESLSINATAAANEVISELMAEPDPIEEDPSA